MGEDGYESDASDFTYSQAGMLKKEKKKPRRMRKTTTITSTIIASSDISTITCSSSCFDKNSSSNGTQQLQQQSTLSNMESLVHVDPAVCTSTTIQLHPCLHRTFSHPAFRWIRPVSTLPADFLDRAWSPFLDFVPDPSLIPPQPSLPPSLPHALAGLEGWDLWAALNEEPDCTYKGLCVYIPSIDRSVGFVFLRFVVW